MLVYGKSYINKGETTKHFEKEGEEREREKKINSEKKKFVRALMKVTTLVCTTVALVALYQLSDYAEHWRYYSVLIHKYSVIAGSEECDVAGKYFGVSPRVEIATLRMDDVISNCSYAKEMSTRSAHLLAFMSFCESKYAYKVATMDSHATKIMAVVITLAVMYFVSDYYKNAYNIERLSVPFQQALSTRSPPKHQKHTPLLLRDKRQKEPWESSVCRVEELEEEEKRIPPPPEKQKRK